MNFIRCIIYLASIGILGFIIGRLLPQKIFYEDVFPYKQFRFEKDGNFYEKFQIRKWKDKLLDMSRIFPKIMPVKRLYNDTACSKSFMEKLPILIKETCIAEFIHSILFLGGFGCVILWKGIGGIIVSLLYAIGNLPFIMVQRYNRPRFIAIVNRHTKRTVSRYGDIPVDSYLPNDSKKSADKVRVCLNFLVEGENTAESNMLCKSHK